MKSSKKQHVSSVLIILLTTLALTITVQVASADTTQPTESLVPTRDQIPTVWVTGDSVESTITASGFVEGHHASYDSSDNVIDLVFDVYRFSDSSSAQSYYNERVNAIKSQGGYEVVAVTGAFGAYFPYDGGCVRASSWGVSGNIVYWVDVYNDGNTFHTQDIKDNLVTFTALEQTILTQNAPYATPEPTIPEFPIGMTLPIVFIGAMVMALVLRKKATNNPRKDVYRQIKYCQY
jgi:hypothetical protein